MQRWEGGGGGGWDRGMKESEGSPTAKGETLGRGDGANRDEEKKGGINLNLSFLTG